MKTNTLYFIFLIAICLLTACSPTRHLSENEFLYRGADFEIQASEQQVSTKELEAEYKLVLQTPRPNKKFLGIRWGLFFHNLFYSKKEKGLLPWLQKTLGEEPVLYSQNIQEQVENILANKAFNKGFFSPQVTSEVKFKNKKAKIKYVVQLNQVSPIKSIVNTIEDSLIQAQVQQIQHKSLLQVGQAYDLKRLKQERDRISFALRQKGFYHFRSDYLKFQADTIRESSAVHLALSLKQNIDSTNLIPKYLDKIWVYPNVNDKLPKDTITYQGLDIVQSQKLLRNTTLRDAISFEKDQRYSLKDHQSTLERLSFLRNHQFINLQLEKSARADSLINLFVQLTPRKRDALKGTLGFSVKSGLYLGPDISVSYLNRNIFKGAEQFSINIFGNYNFPIVENIASLQEQGIRMELSKPGSILSFRKKPWSKNFIAKTNLQLNYTSEKVRIPLDGTQELLEILEFNNLLSNLNADPSYAPFIAFDNFDFSLSYQWRKKLKRQHELTPIKLTWQRPRYEDNDLRELFLLILLVDDSSEDLLLNLEEMILLKPSYRFVYDSQLEKKKTHNYYYKGKLAVSGNRLLSKDNLIPKEFLESQFFQVENDFRYFWKYSAKQTFAYRFISNISVPFKNEVILPFFDLYSVGGPNSIRAYRPRFVGPGSTAPVEELFFVSGTGDILLETNLEWRVKLTKLFELGLFTDIGNTWLIKGAEEARFKFDSFYKQLAIGTGLGLRLDFDILTLRIDLAFPLTKPWLPEGERWIGNKVALGDFNWLFSNVIPNLAFGYSF